MTAFTVSIPVREADLHEVAQFVVDTLEDEYGSDILEMVGVEEDELFSALLVDPSFHKLVISEIMDNGMECLSDPYGYFDCFSFFENVPGLLDICHKADTMIAEIREAKASEQKQTEAMEALFAKFKADPELMAVLLRLSSK